MGLGKCRWCDQPVAAGSVECWECEGDTIQYKAEAALEELGTRYKRDYRPTQE